MEYALILKSLRLAADMSVQELAEKSSISRSNIYKIENNPNATPGIDIVKRWVLATKPIVNNADWLNLTLRLVLDERTAMQLERNEDELSKQSQPISLLNRLLPWRYFNQLK